MTDKKGFTIGELKKLISELSDDDIVPIVMNTRIETVEGLAEVDFDHCVSGRLPIVKGSTIMKCYLIGNVEQDNKFLGEDILCTVSV